MRPSELPLRNSGGGISCFRGNHPLRCRTQSDGTDIPYRRLATPVTSPIWLVKPASSLPGMTLTSICKRVVPPPPCAVHHASHPPDHDSHLDLPADILVCRLSPSCSWIIFPQLIFLQLWLSFLPHLPGTFWLRQISRIWCLSFLLLGFRYNYGDTFSPRAWAFVMELLFRQNYSAPAAFFLTDSFLFQYGTFLSFSCMFTSIVLHSMH